MVVDELLSIDFTKKREVIIDEILGLDRLSTYE
jgi:hypothetical protein